VKSAFKFFRASIRAISDSLTFVRADKNQFSWGKGALILGVIILRVPAKSAGP